MNSNRLVYRLISGEDFDLYYKLHSNDQVMYYAYLDVMHSKERARDLFNKVLTGQGAVMFLVTEEETKEAVGIVDYYQDLAGPGACEIGYFLLPPYWGKGYGYEMATWLIDYIFAKTDNEKIVASCHIDNKNSERIMVKLGLIKSLTEVKTRYKHGQYVDEIRYGISKKEWLKKRS